MNVSDRRGHLRLCGHVESPHGGALVAALDSQIRGIAVATMMTAMRGFLAPAQRGGWTQSIAGTYNRMYRGRPPRRHVLRWERCKVVGSAKCRKLMDACKRNEAMDVWIAPVEKHAVALGLKVDSVFIDWRACPGAGLPSARGGHDEDFEMFSDHILDYAEDGVIDSGGGRWGASPSHVIAVMEKHDESFRASS